MLTTLEEHLGYISDSRRLELFGRAVSFTVVEGDRVADLGCGFGILGLLCLKSGAAHVWGIDRTEAIHVARETMVRAGYSSQYTCLHESSFASAIPGPIDLVICDHVGYFGVDYGIIEMLADAKSRLLKTDGGRIMPRIIKLLMAGITSPSARRKAEAWVHADIPSEYHWLREYGINSKHAFQFSRDDVTVAPILLGSVNLYEDAPELLSFNASMIATQDVLLDGLSGWFECELAEGIWMTNSPLVDERIDRPQAFFCFDEPFILTAGDTIDLSISIRHDSGVIGWSARNCRTGQFQKQSTWLSRIIAPGDLTGCDEHVLQLGPEGLARKVVLNYLDGTLTASEIEETVLKHHADLLPTTKAWRDLVSKELRRSAQ